MFSVPKLNSKEELLVSLSRLGFSTPRRNVAPTFVNLRVLLLKVIATGQLVQVV